MEYVNISFIELYILVGVSHAVPIQISPCNDFIIIIFFFF
jgi:hypothetical protein